MKYFSSNETVNKEEYMEYQRVDKGIIFTEAIVRPWANLPENICEREIVSLNSASGWAIFTVGRLKQGLRLL